MTPLTHPDATTLCPLCGSSNRCSLSDPRTADQACWCFSQTIDPARLDALPEHLRNKACLCPRCAGLLDAHSSDAASRIG
jgi:hypothetical protein